VNGAPVDGNSARNLIDQPGYKDVDWAIFRTFKLRKVSACRPGARQ